MPFFQKTDKKSNRIKMIQQKKIAKKFDFKQINHFLNSKMNFSFFYVVYVPLRPDQLGPGQVRRWGGGGCHRGGGGALTAAAAGGGQRQQQVMIGGGGRRFVAVDQQ
jgi:hypothetical protein